MGKIIDSLLSGTKGRTGNVVVVHNNGFEYTRSRPIRRKMYTPKQLLAQQRFTMANQFMQGYKEFAKMYFGTKIGLSSPYNQAISKVLHAIQVDGDALQLNHSQIEFTYGELLVFQPTQIHALPNHQVEIQWDNNALSTENLSDKIVVLYAYLSNNLYKTQLIKTSATRRDERVVIQVFPDHAQQDIHLWTTCIQENLQKASNSSYLGQVSWP